MRRLVARLRAADLPPWAAGVLVAILLAGALAVELPLLRGMERRATDLMFRYGRADPPAMDARIVHVDIDDSTLANEGDWPWPRRKLAAAVRALDAFGARVIALDILFPNPKDAAGDRALADAIREVDARVVVAMDLLHTRDLLGDTEADRQRLRRVLATLRSDITLDADAIARRLELDTRHAERVRDQISGLKRVAIREAAANGGDQAALEKALVPGRDTLAFFPEQALIRSELARRRATAALAERQPEPRAGDESEAVDGIVPPILPLAEAAHSAGAAHAEPDGDGPIRRLRLRWEHRGRIYRQLGFAAAAAFEGRAPDAPARNEVLLSWPRLPDAGAVGFTRHIPLGLVLELGRRQEELERERADFVAHSRENAPRVLEEWSAEAIADPAALRDLLSEMADAAHWFVGDGEEPGADATEEERSKYYFARAWLKRQEEIAAADARLAGTRARLRSALAGRIVFVGWNASGNFGDFYPTVLRERTPGVIAHGVVANSILTGYWVRRAPRWVGVLVTLLLGVAAAGAASRAGPRLSFLVTLLLVVGYGAANTVLVFGANVALASVAPTGAAFGAWVAGTAARAVRERRERAQLERQFGARISPRLFAYLVENPDRVHLEGEEREVTSFFSDLGGFTALSESLDSRATVALLNRYMWEMNDELTKHGAYVNKFLGDGIMAVFGAFSRDDAHAEAACRAALGCSARLRRLNADPGFAPGGALTMRMGLATGVVTLGDCGAPPDLRDYTVIGDSVNLAARLESASKQFGTAILVNERTRELAPGNLASRRIGRLTVVGQKRATDVHEIVAAADDLTESQRALIDETDAAVRLFAAGDLDAAETAWRGFAARHDEPPLARLYLAEIAAARSTGLPPGGVLHLDRK